MRPTFSSTLWLELLGGLLIVLGALLAWWAYTLANYPPDSGISRALDQPGFSECAGGLPRFLRGDRPADFGVWGYPGGAGGGTFFRGGVSGALFPLGAGGGGGFCGGGLVLDRSLEGLGLLIVRSAARSNA